VNQFREIIATIALTLKGSRTGTSLVVERKFAEEALAKIRAGEALDGGHSLVVMRIIAQALAGYDPRKGLGVAPKAGRMPILAGHHAFLAAHFWSLRESKGLEKEAASAVAELWGVSLGRVRKIAVEYKGKADVLRAQLTADEIAQWSALCAEHS
jgi:hypothetical protein